MKSGTILIDPRVAYIRNLGALNNTIIHECVHWHIHRKAFGAFGRTTRFFLICTRGFGTGDCVIIADDRLQIIDLKYGIGVLVSAEENPQMMLYALGALSTYGNLYDIKEVGMTIFQPRRENISTWTIPVEQLYQWAEEVVIPTALLAIQGKGKFNPGSHCTFCKAKAQCRARAEANMKIAQLEFQKPALLQDDEIEEALSVITDLTKWANEVQAYGC